VVTVPVTSGVNQIVDSESYHTLLSNLVMISETELFSLPQFGHHVENTYISSSEMSELDQDTTASEEGGGGRGGRGVTVSLWW
jgi:hypothetical protein